MNKNHEIAQAINARTATRGGMPVRVVRPLATGSEKRPGKTSGWRIQKRLQPSIDEHMEAVSFSVWRRDGIFVVSALEFATAPDGKKDVIPQWHLSCSRYGVRCSDVEARQVIASFGMTGAEEDNHHPGGGSRHFWLPVDPKRRVDCECKEDELVVVEADGYTSTTPKDGPCSGCDLVAAKRDLGIDGECPLHPRDLVAAVKAALAAPDEATVAREKNEEPGR